MSSFSLSGGVQVFGFISPSDTSDQYAVIDPLYGIDGLRNVDLLSDLDNIPTLRRRPGMVVGVSGGTAYYKLNLPPWNNTISDWSIFSSGGGGVSGDFLSLSGGVVTGLTEFQSGLTSNQLTVSGDSFLNGIISSLNFSGTTDRIVEVNSGGTLTATTQIISAYISSGSTVGNLLSDTNNWDINGNYIGIPITGTFQGQKFYDVSYFYEAIDNNLFIRLIRG